MDQTCERFDLQVFDPGHRGLLLTLLAFLRERAFRFPEETLAVILPETGAPLWKRLFFHPTTLKLKALLFFQPHFVVTNVSFQQHAPSRQLPISPDKIRHRFIVPVADLDRAAIQSLAYARSISSHVVAVHVALDEQDAENIRAHWRQFQEHLSSEERVQLVIAPTCDASPGYARNWFGDPQSAAGGHTVLAYRREWSAQPDRDRVDRAKNAPRYQNCCHVARKMAQTLEINAPSWLSLVRYPTYHEAFLSRYFLRLSAPQTPRECARPIVLRS